MEKYEVFEMNRLDLEATTFKSIGREDMHGYIISDDNHQYCWRFDYDLITDDLELLRYVIREHVPDHLELIKLCKDDAIYINSHRYEANITRPIIDVEFTLLVDEFGSDNDNFPLIY